MGFSRVVVVGFAVVKPICPLGRVFRYVSTGSLSF